MSKSGSDKFQNLCAKTFIIYQYRTVLSVILKYPNLNK